MKKENFIKKFRYITAITMMAGIFLTACGSGKDEKVKQELGLAVQDKIPLEMLTKLYSKIQSEIQPEPGSNSWSQAYLLLIEEMIRKMREDGYTGSEMHYSLIYLDDDDIPELVYGPDGYWVSVYTWQDGQIYTVMDKEPYGTWGRVYFYVPFQSIVGTECYSFGDTSNGFYTGRYWDFYRMTDTAYELEYFYGLSWVETRENETDESGTTVYYYEEPDLTKREITEEEFAAYDVTDGHKYILLIGDSSAYEIINELMHPDKS